jgi:5-methylcytosine-specific restriction endonuclease McrA
VIKNYKDLISYNSFYQKKECRNMILKLNKNKCQGCNTPLQLNKEYHVGHIVPKKDKTIFKQMFPELDVDNILNLHALCSTCNLKANDAQHYSYFMLNQLFNENLKIIQKRLHKIENDESMMITKLQTFLKKNTHIDLFNKKAQKIKNNDILDTIYSLKANKGNFIILNKDNQLLNKYLVFKMVDNVIIENKSAYIDDLFIIKTKKEMESDSLYIYRVIDREKKHIKKELVDLAKEI